MMTTKEKDDEQTDPQTELLADHRENEIGVRVGKVEHFLAAVPEAEAFHSTAAPRDQCLHLLQASVVLEAFGIHKGGEPGHALRHLGRDEESPPTPPNESSRGKRICSRDEHDHKRVAPISAVVPRSTSAEQREQRAS